MAKHEYKPLSIEQLRLIRIPKADILPYAGYGKQDVTLEVQPLDDSWIADNARSVDEVDMAVERRLQEVQLSIRVPQDSLIAKNYGIEHPVLGEMERIIAYSEVVQDAAYSQRHNNSQAASLRREYEANKELLKARIGARKDGISKGKYQQLITQQGKELEGQVFPYSRKAEAAGQVRDLILRKFVLEFFSANPDQNNDQGTMITRFSTYIAHIYGMTTERNPQILDFIHEVSDYLRRTQDKHLLQKFRYKPTANLSGAKSDFQIMSTVQDWVFQPEAALSELQCQSEFRRLGMNMILFLQKQARFKSTRPELSDTDIPHLSLIYDLINTTLSRGKISDYKKLRQLLDSEFADFVEDRAIKNELTRVYDRVNRVYDQPEFILDMNMGASNGTEKKLELPQGFIDFITSPEYRMTSALATIDNSMYGANDFIRSRALARLRSQWDTVQKSRSKRYSNEDILILNTVFQQMYSFIRDQETYHEVGIDFDIFDFLQRNTSLIDRYQDKIAGVASEPFEKRERDFQTRAKVIKVSSSTKEMKEHFLTSDYLASFWYEELGDDARRTIERTERENVHLWREVLDNPIWFVSPRGDKFIGEDDPQLVSKAIESLTVRIDKAHPREHKVILMIAQVQEPLEFWLDTNRQLLNSSRRLVNVDTAVMQVFTNALLKRLYYITSGLLSTDQEQERKIAGEGDKVPYRRAYYRIMESTDTRPITMRSPGAQTHAKEVLEEYGIDIYNEIQRRRDARTLRPDQYLTFVRETGGENFARNVLPNIIKYDPMAIDIPVEEG